MDKYMKNSRNCANGIDLLSSLEDRTVKAAFFDPQYRGVLDKLHYGNEGKGRGMARANLTQMTTETIKSFIKELDRVLVPSGYLFIWVDKFHLCEGINVWLEETNFKITDMITWVKTTKNGNFEMGMGHRSRHCSEYVVITQKHPQKAIGYWNDHKLLDVWPEAVTKNHPHSKPIELQRRLIEAVTNKRDLVIDPAAGGYSVLEACRLSGREFLGCDLKAE